MWFGARQADFMFRHQRRLGDVWSADAYVRGHPVVTCHPEHVRSLFTAPPELVPTLASESPLAPLLGPHSTLTANPPRHLPQRKLLLPSFHGEAIARYQALIVDAVEREIDRWPIGRAFPLARRMQAITLEVIMGGIFGVTGRPEPGSPEHHLRAAIRRLNSGARLPGAKLGEWMNLGHEEPFGILKLALVIPDRALYAVIDKRRQAADLEERTDIMSLIMRARPDEGDGTAAGGGTGAAGGRRADGTLDDRALRDELMTLVLAGHETTAHQLAWTWERLLRSPQARSDLVEAVRSGSPDTDVLIEATLTESMRSRPVIPIIGRRVQRAWRLGEYGIPADTAVAVSVLLLHHREDVYPDPFSFRPERWVEPDEDAEGEGTRLKAIKPTTYEWIPFGGGTRRCLGAALAMAEMRVVLRTMIERLDLEAADPKPERPLHRNVTMIPGRGGRVVVTGRLG